MLSHEYIEVKTWINTNAKFVDTYTTLKTTNLKQKQYPGTSFDDLPDLWRCPKCGAGKIRFIKV